MESIKKQARIAGLLYLLMGITAPLGLVIAPARLIVKGDAVATAERIRASEWLMRAGIGSELFHQVLAVFVVLALYKLFKRVNEPLAVAMVVLSLLGQPIVMFNCVFEIAAITLVKGAPFLAAFDQSQRESLAYLFLRLHSQGIEIASIFWGLWLFPFAMLVIRSGFIPKFLGYLMVLAGIGYLAAATTSLLMPQYEQAVGSVALLLEIGEPPIIFWLAIWGAREPRTGAAAAG